MSDKNIDKDIETLKQVQAIFEHLKKHGWINDIKREADINKVILTISRAIEYIKYAELTKIACCTAQNCEALNNSIRFGKELETYKNMADLMAKQINNYDAQLVINRFRSKEEVLEWAKSEVLKNE